MYSSGDVRVEDVPDPTITAPTDAVVGSVPVVVGATVDTGTVLIVLEGNDDEETADE